MVMGWVGGGGDGPQRPASPATTAPKGPGHPASPQGTQTASCKASQRRRGIPATSGPARSQHILSSRVAGSSLKVLCRARLPEGTGLEPPGSPHGTWLPERLGSMQQLCGEPWASLAAEQPAGPARVSCDPRALPPPQRGPLCQPTGGQGRMLRATHAGPGESLPCRTAGPNGANPTPPGSFTQQQQQQQGQTRTAKAALSTDTTENTRNGERGRRVPAERGRVSICSRLPPSCQGQRRKEASSPSICPQGPRGRKGRTLCPQLTLGRCWQGGRHWGQEQRSVWAVQTPRNAPVGPGSSWGRRGVA